VVYKYQGNKGRMKVFKKLKKKIKWATRCGVAIPYGSLARLPGGGGGGSAARSNASPISLHPPPLLCLRRWQGVGGGGFFETYISYI